MKTIDDFNFKNKLVLLRIDINSEVVGKKILMSERIKESAKTISELKKEKARIILLSHQGRPGKSDCLSLKQHAKFLNKFTKIKFVDDILGKKAEREINNLKPGEAILLENVRFLKEEFSSGKNKFVNKFVKIADIYVNDSFSVSHRNQASIVSFPKYMKSCAGRLLEKEVNAIKKIKLKKALYILAGAKPEDNIKLIKQNKVLSCGLFGQLCLIAKGKDLGAQNVYLKENIENYEENINKLRNKSKKIITPEDFAVNFKGKRKELDLKEFPNKYEIFDIGEKTIKNYVKEIKRARVIFMKGPAGYCADKKFCKGTFSLLKAIANNKGFSLIGGGHLSDAIKISKINKNLFNHISLSGGALLSYISGEKLPGLEALK